VIEAYRRRFGGAENPRVFRAPGRVNLIGEHTDYNLGFVLPVALDLACFVAAGPNHDGKLQAYSENLDNERSWAIGGLPHLTRAGEWTDYVAGVAQQLLRRGFEIPPVNLYIRSTVPEGGGLSSSAALEVSTALALLGGREVPGVELARLCQEAEIHFVGMPCGIMDQYVSVFGQEHAAIKIDCRSMEHETVTLPEGIEILAVNTMVKHALGQSAYRQRTIECAAAVEILQRKFPEVHSLRDATLEQLEEAAEHMSRDVFRRARHVIGEGQRVTDFVAASRAGDRGVMGRLFVESHRSLQHDYEVSCPELDFLVDTAISRPELVYGSRMTGGGFGGCTVNLIASGAAGAFEAWISAEYRNAFGVQPEVYVCKPSAGAGEVN
jgi:galactokinase